MKLEKKQRTGEGKEFPQCLVQPFGLINSFFYFSPQGLLMTLIKETRREGSSQGEAGGLISLTEGGDAAGRTRKKPR